MALKLIFMGTPNFAVPILQSIVKHSDHKISQFILNRQKKVIEDRKLTYPHS